MKLTDMLRAKGKTQDEEELKVQGWSEQVQSVPIDTIRPNPFQPRMEFESASLDELARSIEEHGVLHPVIVRKLEDHYELIVGERRLRACKQLGWETMPAIVKELDDKAAGEMALIENLQRKDLHFFEEAEGYRRLLDEFALTQDELARRLGKSQSSIANRLRLLKLWPAVQQAVSREGLSERHARSLLRLDKEEQQLQVVKEVVRDSLNVRQTEELVERVLHGDDVEEPTKQTRRIVFKDLRLFTNSLRELTKSLSASGLAVDLDEEDLDDEYRVTIVVNKRERGE